MIVAVTLPQLGETADEAEILVWLKQVGEPVARGEPLLEVHTDKITVEIPALQAGVLTEIIAAPGQVVAVGAPVARLETDAADVADAADAGSGSAGATAAGTEAAQAGAQAEAQVDAAERVAPPDPAPVASAPSRPGRVRASPSARRRARELGVALDDLTGSGPHGRITRADVERGVAPSAPTAPADPADPPSGPPPLRPPGGASSAAATDAPGAASPEVHPLTRIERATARSTAAAFAEMPHFYVSVRAEAGELARRLEREAGVSVNDALVLACARTLRQHPRLNATFDGDRLILHDRIDIGVITATSEGVVASVVRAADTLGLRDIHRRVREVRARVAAGRAGSDDVSGATFCISNLGMFDVDTFSAILPPDNTAILAVGTLREEALVENGALRFGRTMSLTVSADHRALDGVGVALFLTSLRATLRSPHNLFEPGAIGSTA